MNTRPLRLIASLYHLLQTSFKSSVYVIVAASLMIIVVTVLFVVRRIFHPAHQKIEFFFVEAFRMSITLTSNNEKVNYTVTSSLFIILNIIYLLIYYLLRFAATQMAITYRFMSYIKEKTCIQHGAWMGLKVVAITFQLTADAFSRLVCKRVCHLLKPTLTF